MENRPYRPSNGTEGMIFCEQYCNNCINGKFEHTQSHADKPCEILTLSFCCDIGDKDYPKEWVYNEKGNGICTAFVPWDWKKDDDGNWIDPPPPPIDDPNQLLLPFALNEIALTPEPEYQQ